MEFTDQKKCITSSFIPRLLNFNFVRRTLAKKVFSPGSANYTCVPHLLYYFTPKFSVDYSKAREGLSRRYTLLF